jgi:hypothetical protein
MAENYKILAQEFVEDVDSASGLNQAKAVYTVPAGNQVSASSISVINNGPTSESYKLGIVKAADASSSNEIKNVYTAEFVAVAQGSTTAAYSTDGITWTQTTMPATTDWLSVTHGNGKFVAVAQYSTTAAYSTDGIAWTQSTLPSGVQTGALSHLW